MKSNTDRILLILLCLFVAALGWTIVSGMRERVVEVGDKAPDFRVVTDDGKTMTPEDFGGRVLVLNFWAAWCEPCVEETPSLNRFARQTAGSGVVVLGISIDRNQKLYDQFRQRFHVAFETSRDPEANIAASYGTYKVPETYIIGRDGKVARKIISNIDWTDPEVIRFATSL